MITISDADKEIWLTDSTHKNLTITFPAANITLTNSDLVSQSLKMTEKMETEADLMFEGCNATELTFEVANFISDVRGEEVVVTISADGASESITLFTGYVDSETNVNHEDVVTKITAYDVLYKINNTDVSGWYSALTFPMTLKAFRDSFFAYFGVTQKTATLEFDSMSVSKTIDAESISGLTIIQSICQLNAVYGRIGRDGSFEYVKLTPIGKGLYPRDDLYPGDNLYPMDVVQNANIRTTYRKKITYENFECAPIDKVQIRQEEDDIGGVYGSGTNAYVIEGNFLAYGLDADTLNNMASRIYNLVNGLVYMPFDVECIGMPWIECGDKVEMGTKKNFVYSYIMQRTLSGIQSLSDSYSTDGEQYRDTQINSVNNSITQILGKANKLSRTVNETKSELTSYETTTDGTLKSMSSSITQNANAITAEVTRASDAEGQLSSKITQTAESITSEVAKTYETKDNVTSKISQSATDILSTVSQTYETKENVTSKIAQSASDIELSVSQTYETKSDATASFALKLDKTDDNTVVSLMEGYADKISFSSKEMNFKSNSVVISSDKFSLSKDGTISASALSITGGSIDITSSSSSLDIIKLTYGSSSVSINPLSITVKTSSNSTVIDDDSVIIKNSSYSNTANANQIELKGSTCTNTIANTGITIKSSTTSIGNAIIEPNEIDIATSNKIECTSSVMWLHNSNASNSILIGSSSTTYLGFFASGTSATTKAVQQKVPKLATTATLANVITKVNDLITALNAYNLIKLS